jgi:uncharacterized iron-regulated membrane protein
MSTIAYVVGGLALTGAVIVGVMFWIGRRPMDRGAVSTQWRDDQIRGRRE